MDSVTLIEKLCVAWIVAVLVAIVTMASAVAFGQTSTATAPEDLHFAIRQISDGELTGVIAGLVLVFGALMRNAAVRAFFPLLIQWTADRLADLPRRRKRKRGPK